ncbi:hypothetical protein [Marinobacter sp. MIT932201]|uniref:hypothetical protein n=1 Tax=Marinobacter sp. MIT932201 TaxID=3096995 RepID=UPI00399A22A0
MITTRLNRLLKAYRIAKSLFGDANRGRALPGPVFRWCHKIRMAVWAEIDLVRRLIPHIRPANLKQENPMAYRTEVNDAGESPSASSRRQDDKAMRDIISALQDGAHLRIHPKVRRAAIEGLPEKDARNGRTISAHRCKKLAKEGIIREVAMDRYAFNPDLELEAL